MSILQEIKDRITDITLRDKIIRQIEIQNETINNLESCVRSQKELILQLKEELNTLKKSNNTIQSLDKTNEVFSINEEMEKILVILSDNEGHEIMPQQIASMLNISLTRAKGLLQKLEDAEYVYTPLILGDRDHGYVLLSKGREYLISKNLV